MAEHSTVRRAVQCVVRLGFYSVSISKPHPSVEVMLAVLPFLFPLMKSMVVNLPAGDCRWMYVDRPDGLMAAVTQTVRGFHTVLRKKPQSDY